MQDTQPQKADGSLAINRLVVRLVLSAVVSLFRALNQIE